MNEIDRGQQRQQTMDSTRTPPSCQRLEIGAASQGVCLNSSPMDSGVWCGGDHLSNNLSDITERKPFYSLRSCINREGRR
ncbi:hypothetical protein Q5P01_022792 [Channa striata]|uniref:Uncharacterized protein n=1 Tax=Channa striata TaxID=64152 RepID=A0AA88RWB7_CHASR|nr:hypothetical protein Q5P01_022792 [Channa striata]